MQLLSLWSFGFVAVATVFLFGGFYLLGRRVRRFLAWANGTEPPKEKVAFFLPLYLFIGLIISGFTQTIFDAGAMCHQYQQPLIPCTVKVISQHPVS